MNEKEAKPQAVEEAPPKAKADLGSLEAEAVKIGKKARPYGWLALIIFFVIVYAYVFLGIHNNLNTQPTQTQISSNLKTTAQPTINPAVVNQIEQLQNNSVSVQALFNQARQNPFGQ